MDVNYLHHHAMILTLILKTGFFNIDSRQFKKKKEKKEIIMK